MRKVLLFVFLLAAAGGLTSCAGGENASLPVIAGWEPTPNTEREWAAPPTLMPTQTAVSIPTRRPTVTAVPDQPIPTPLPTLVPVGVYVRETDGLVVNYPANWEITDESESHVQFYDSAMNVVLNVFSDYVDEDAYEVLLDQFLAADVDVMGFQDMEVVAEESVSFGNKTAQLAWLSGIDADASPLGVFIAYGDDGLRNLVMVGYGDIESLTNRKSTLMAMVSQAQLGGSQLFGLPKDETLVLLGGDPLPRDLDPARTTGSAAGYIGLLYSGLVRLSPNLQVVPDLAESWVINADGTEYTFTLREGLTFATGQPLTAADVQFSWERAADPETGSTTVATYMADIVGVSEKLNGDAESIAGIEVIDDRTLVVTLDGPKPYFLAKLTYPTSYVVDEESVGSVDDDEWVFDPNPSGPYDLADYQENEMITFVRNDAYYAPPAIQNVLYQIARVGNRISLFASGEVDLVYLGATDALEVQKSSHPQHDQWVSTASLCTTLVQMNNTMPPMDDLNVRRAFALAVDKDGLNELLSEGTNLVADTIFPPAMPGYSQTFAQEQSAQRFNEEAARAALAASQYAEGLPPVVISAGGFGDSERDDLNAMVEMWRDVLDAEVTIEFLDPVNFSDVVSTDHGHMVSYGWCADYVDPENFLDVLYHSESAYNVSGYVNEEVDALLEEARVTLDVGERLALYQQIEQMLIADGAAIPLSHGISDALVSERVQGFVLSPMGAPIVPLLSLETAVSGE